VEPLYEDRALAIAQKQVAIYAIAVAAYELVEDVEEAFLRGSTSMYFFNDYRASAFVHAETALKAIPLHDLSSYSLVRGILGLCDAVSGTAKFCEEQSQNPLANFSTEEQYAVAVEDLAMLAKQGFTYIESAVAQARHLQLTGKYKDNALPEV
jgi:hypothetical protein